MQQQQLLSSGAAAPPTAGTQNSVHGCEKAWTSVILIVWFRLVTCTITLLNWSTLIYCKYIIISARHGQTLLEACEKLWVPLSCFLLVSICGKMALTSYAIKHPHLQAKEKDLLKWNNELKVILGNGKEHPDGFDSLRCAWYNYMWSFPILLFLLHRFVNQL